MTLAALLDLASRLAALPEGARFALVEAGAGRLFDRPEIPETLGAELELAADWLEELLDALELGDDRDEELLDSADRAQGALDRALRRRGLAERPRL